jgi:NitT/TauT family transport system substrate-binding protein
MIRAIARLLVLVPSIAFMTACSSPSSAPQDDSQLQRVVLMLNWYPEAEHGGFYAAKEHGIFAEYGLDVEIRAGGPNAPVAQELVTGRVEFAIGNADDVLLFRNQDVPVVALMAPMQNTPRCVLVRDDSPATKLSELKGMVLQANVGRPFLTFMESEGLLEGVQVVPYAGTVAKLVSDSNTAIQAYSFSEPFMAKEQGITVRRLMLSDIGFNPYASCLLSTEKYVAENQDLVSRMVVACREGWKKYLASPEKTNATILAANAQGMTAEALKFGVTELQPLCLPDGLPEDELGMMTSERWTSLMEQFSKLGLVDQSKFTVSQVFTTQFINRTSAVE